MERRDRVADAIRPMSISHTVLSRADGSASFSFGALCQSISSEDSSANQTVRNAGSLTVLSSVNGPQEVRVRDELVDRASLEIIVRPLRSSSGPREKSIETTLRSLFEPVIRLERYPRSQIQINVQTTSAPGLDSSSPSNTFTLSEKAAIVNSVTCALMDAGIEMDALLLSVALARVNGELRLDPHIEEEAKASQALCFVGRIAGDRVDSVGLEGVGFADTDELFEAIERGEQAVRAIHAFVRRSIETKYSTRPNDSQVQALSGRKQENETPVIDMRPADVSDESDAMSE